MAETRFHHIPGGFRVLLTLKTVKWKSIYQLNKRVEFLRIEG